MAKKKTDRNHAATTIALKRKPKKVAKAPMPRLTAARLRELAAKHKPPQSWYDEDLDDV